MITEKKKWSSNEFHFIYVLFHFAVVAGQYAVHHVEVGLHRFVVGDAFGIVAFHDAPYLLRCRYRLLLYYFKVTDDIQHDIRCDNGETGDLLIGKPFVLHLDNTFLP